MSRRGRVSQSALSLPLDPRPADTPAKDPPADPEKTREADHEPKRHADVLDRDDGVSALSLAVMYTQATTPASSQASVAGSSPVVRSALPPEIWL